MPGREFTWHFTATWRDVQEKAKRIKDSGHVRIISSSPQYLVGEVRGDTNIYQSTIHFVPGTRQIATWECGCAWAAYSWGRSGRWKKYEGRQCVPPETMISMADGTFKRIDEVEVGDWVVTHRGVGPVEQVFVSDYDGHLHVIESAGYALPLSITGEHEVWGYGTPDRLRKSWQDENGQGFKFYDESFLLDEQPSWIDASQMRRHDWLTGPIRDTTFSGRFDLGALLSEREVDHVVEDGRVWTTHPRGRHQNSMPDSIVPSRALMEVLGIYLAEGNFNTRRTEIQWTIHEDEVETLGKRLQVALDELGAGTLRQYARPEFTKGVSLRLTNRPLALLLKELAGEGSRSKGLHPWVMMLSPDWQEMLLDAYWAGDGSQSDSRLKFTTASDLLAQQVFDLLVRCGHLPSWSRGEVNGGPTDREARFTQNTVSYVPDPRYTNGRRWGSGYYAAKISKVSTEPYQGKVYNLKVTGDESYVANGRIVHNCSHSLALLWEGQSRGMFGQEVAEDASKPKWMSDPSITVKVPGDYKKPEIGEWRLSSKTAGLSPAEDMARTLLAEGESPARVLAQFTKLGVQNGPSILNRIQGAPTPVEESTSNTDTGVTVTLATAEWLGLDPKGSKWYLVCEDHGELLSGTNRATLKSHMRSPSQWCETCRETKTSMRRKAQADTDGVMIALRPPDHILEAVQVEGGEPFDQLHVTVIYLGGTDEVDKDALVDAVMVWADVTGSMPAQLSGYGMFENDRVLYAAVDVVGLDRARTELIDALGIFGIEVTERHGMQPHLTLMYGADEIPDEMPSAAMEEFTFTEAILAYGGDWMTFPLLGEPEIRAEAQKKTGSLYSSLMSLRSAFIEAAQMEYDAWNQEGPGYGICDEIAARMSSIIAERISGVEVLDGGHDGDDHAWLLVVDHNEEVAYGVDISQDHYETGGGYSWTKKPGVRFSVDMVDIWEADYELVRDNRGFDDFYSYGELKKSPEPALPEVTGEEDDTIKTEIPEFEPEPEVDEFVEDVPKPGDPRLAWLVNGVSKKGGDDMDIAGAARAFLKKTALKDFSPAEQRELIEEGEAEGVIASNLDRLDIAGTHYEALEAARQSEDDEELWLL